MNLQSSARHIGAACVLWTAVGAGAATAFDTPGPFVYSAVGTASTYTFGPNPVHVASGSLVIDGQGGIGVAKVGLQYGGTGSAGAVWAGWNDSLTFSAGTALAGTTGVVTLKMNYSWSAQVSGTASADAYLDINLIRAGTPSQYVYVGETVTRSCSVAGQCGGLEAFAINTTVPTFANGVATIKLNVVFGAEYTMVAGMTVDNLQGQGALSVDAMHSLYWGGITSVTAAGAPVTTYQVASGSGFNYVQAVPEAPTWALWGLGALALTGWTARRRRRD